MEPLAAQALVRVMKNAGENIVQWAEEKLKTDINGDGVIGNLE